MTCEACGKDGGHGSTGLSGCPYTPSGGARGARGADITWPGGRTFEHLADTPQTFHSPAELKRYLKQTNQAEFVRHVPVPGSDKSPHTTRWDTISADTLTQARILLERVGTGGRQPEPQTWIRSFEVTVTDTPTERVRGTR